MLTEKELRHKAAEALAERLGPVEAFRFLALVSREPFDYQHWRKEYFSHFNVDELLGEVESTTAERLRKFWYSMQDALGLS